MKFSENWLRQWVNTPDSVEILSDKLTLAGLEVEAITKLGHALNLVHVGQIMTVSAHPTADRLQICEVLIDNKRPLLSIVCGATNVRVGLKVAVAEIGALLPNNISIKASKIRGIMSEGMLCSGAELRLTETANGIMELPDDAPLGLAINTYLELPDCLLEINLTPNRGDCLSVQGLVRELTAIGPYSTFSRPASLQAITYPIKTPSVQLEAPKACPRYLGRVIQGINPTAITPLWLQNRLQHSHIRCIHPVVDIMNYVMLELGQPLHAFDLSTIQHSITIRYSQPQESVKLLDGTLLTLAEKALVIADTHQILALAGIMGGASSAVAAHTTDIFIESAFFTPEAIRGTARRLHLQSEAAYRYERGVDPNLPKEAIARATELVLEICKGKAGPLQVEESLEHLPKPITILLRTSRIKRVLGIDLTTAEIATYLQRLQMQLQPHLEGWQVTVPSYRFDLKLEVDLIEELARLYGYSQIPSQPLTTQLIKQPVSQTQLPLSRIQHYFVDQGYQETINYSFISPQLTALFSPNTDTLTLSNAISTDMSVMRISLLPGLLQATLFNLNRQQKRIKLFEIGTCFYKDQQGLQQPRKLAGMAMGSVAPVQWGLNQRNIDFFDIKAELENLFVLTNSLDFSFKPAPHPALHPGRCAIIYRADKAIGYVGEIHPAIQQTFDLITPIYVFELNLVDLLTCVLPTYKPLSKYPAIQRDLAFLVPKTICFQQIYTLLKQEAGAFLQKLHLFDVYQGANIPNTQKSMAISLLFQSTLGTLTETEVDAVIQHLIKVLKTQLEVTLRPF